MGVIKPGQEQMIYGEGIPIRKDGSVKKKGNMNVKWEVVFPDRWTLSFPSCLFATRIYKYPINRLEHKGNRTRY